MHSYTDEREIKGDFLLEDMVECEATYLIQVDYYRGKLSGIGPAVLIEWTLPNAGTTHNRKMLVALVGDDEVKRQEAITEEQFRDNPPGWSFSRRSA